MQIRFDAPIFLLAIPLVIAGIWVTRQRVLSLWGWRRDISGALRFGAAAGLALALAQPSIRVPDNAMSVALAVDLSNSMSPAAHRAAVSAVEDAFRSKQPADRVGVVAFGNEARVAQPLGTTEVAPQLPAGGSIATATDLSQALRLAAAMVRGQATPRVVLMSDGRATAGDIDAALRDVNDVPIDVVATAAPPDVPEVTLDSIQAPHYVRAGETYDGNLLISSTRAGPARVQIAVDGTIVSEEPVQLNVGRNRVTISPTVSQEGFHPIAVRVLADQDTDLANNVAFDFVVVKPKARVLLIEEREREGAGLVATLRQSELTLDIRPPESMPPLARLNDYSAVILNNVAATSFTLDQQKTLQTYVSNSGHGLVTIGGLTSYALGGYAETVLEEALPVLAKPPEKREGAQIALLLIIDRSASMDKDVEGVQKMEVAKEAAILASRALNPKDTIGVLVFDRKFDWIVRPGVIEQIGLQTIEQRIQRLTAEGGTDIFQALKEGSDVMRGIRADLKHIVLVSDGRGTEVKYDDLMVRLRQDRIGLSIVAVGEDSDTELMPRLARLGQGRYYFTERILELPRIITSEAALAKRAALVEGHILPQFVNSSPILRTIAPNQIPALEGHIATTAKDTAQVILSSDENSPLLAQWHYGLGRAVSWTSDAGARWTGGWSQWDQNTRFWEQTIRWAMGPPIDRDFRVDVRRDADEARILLENIRDGRYADLENLSATVTTPSGATSQVPLRQIAPGQYEAIVSAGSPGAYAVSVSEGGRDPRSEINGFVVPPVAESTSFEANQRVLRRIASETGGNVLNSPSDAYRASRAAENFRWDPIWPALAVFGFMLFILDVAVRRLRPTTLRALFGRSRAVEAPF